MGGSAFSSAEHNLYTPRMPRCVYEAVKHQCIAVLRDQYEHVAAPIEGPEKADFGDLDLTVAGPRKESPNTLDALHGIERALGADKSILFENSTSNFALPWPTAAVDGTPLPQEASLDGRARHIQVDVRICSSPEKQQWILFKHAHGDIWNIIGSTIRPYGLTADETALWLRVPEIEETNRNRAKVFLTSDPDEVLDFLGLDASRYRERPFDSLDEMYEYVARCRMFHVAAATHPEETQGGPPAERTTAAEEDVKKLKSNDRKRMKQRPAFRRWIDDFTQRCRAEGRFAAPRTSRARVTDEALARFGQEAEYAARRSAYLLEAQERMIWTDLIKGGVAAAADGSDNDNPCATTYRACLVKALKAIILEGDESYGVTPREPLRAPPPAEGFFHLDRVRDFIAERRDEVGEAAMRRHRSKSAEHMAAKRAKDQEKTETAAAAEA